MPCRLPARALPYDWGSDVPADAVGARLIQGLAQRGLRHGVPGRRCADGRRRHACAFARLMFNRTGTSRCPARECFPCVPPWLARRSPFFTGEWDPITRIEARGCFRLRPALVSGPGCPRLPAGLGQARWCRLNRPARRSFRNRSSAIETGGTFPSCTVPWASLESAEEVEVYELYHVALADGRIPLTKEVVVYGIYDLVLINHVVAVGIIAIFQGLL